MNINPQVARDAIEALEYWASTSGSPNFTDRHQMHEPTKRALRWMRLALSAYETSSTNGAGKRHGPQCNDGPCKGDC